VCGVSSSSVILYWHLTAACSASARKVQAHVITGTAAVAATACHWFEFAQVVTFG
jgi:hypothetical protein